MFVIQILVAQPKSDYWKVAITVTKQEVFMVIRMIYIAKVTLGRNYIETKKVTESTASYFKIGKLIWLNITN